MSTLPTVRIATVNGLVGERPMAARPMPSAMAGIRMCWVLPQRLVPHTMVGQVPGR